MPQAGTYGGNIWSGGFCKNVDSSCGFMCYWESINLKLQYLLFFFEAYRVEKYICKPSKRFIKYICFDWIGFKNWRNCCKINSRLFHQHKNPRLFQILSQEQQMRSFMWRYYHTGRSVFFYIDVSSHNSILHEIVWIYENIKAIIVASSFVRLTRNQTYIRYQIMHSKNQQYTLTKFRWESVKKFFCPNGSRDCLNWTKPSNILGRCRRRKPELWSKYHEQKLLKLLESSKECLKSPETTQTFFFKLLVFRPMVHIGQSKLSVCQKYPKDTRQCFVGPGLT